jgi:hypothetical protein
MQQLFSILNQLLSHRKASAIVVLLAVAARIIQLIFYLDSFFDTTFQAIATQNFAEGHGISTAVVQSGNLSSVIYQPLIKWPPGYSLLLSPFYVATGHNYLFACLILDILAATAVIFITRKILKLLDVSLPVINAFTLLTGFFIYYFYYKSPADGVSVALLLAAICVTLSVIKSNNKWLVKSVTAGLCLFLVATMKYLFFPVVFTVPVFLFLYGYQRRSRVLINAAALSFCIAAAGISLLYFYQKDISGAGTYISSPNRGFFPGQLLQLHPYIPAAFVTSNTVWQLPESFAGPLMNLFRLIHIIIYPVIVFIAARYFFKTGFRKMSLQITFLLLCLSITLALCFVLIILSLLVEKEQILPGQWWTYVEDARYYGIADILLHLSVFLLLFHYRQKVRGMLRAILIILPFLLLPEAIRGVGFTANRVIRAGKENYYWQDEKEFLDYGAKLLQQKKDSSGIKRACVSGSLYYINYRASLQIQLPVLEDAAVLNNPTGLKASEPMWLLAIIQKEQLPAFQPFTNYPATQLAGQFNGFYFYTLYVAPR